MADLDPLADWIATADAGNEAYITAMALTDATVATWPSGDLRKALGALRAVLELHRPEGEMGVDALWCSECVRYDGGMALWPCPTVQAITRELLGEDNGHD